MKTFYFILLFLLSVPALSQPKTERLVVVTIDGYRWQELFRGADSARTFQKRWLGIDSVTKVNKFWTANPEERRSKLMPFFWNYIAKHGQVYGNRDLGNNVNVTNPFWVSHAGYNEIFTGYGHPTVTNGSGPNPNITLLEHLNNQKKYKDKVAVIASWDEYYDIFNQKRSGLYINAGWADVEGKNLTEVQKMANLQNRLMPRPLGNTERLDAVTYPLAKDYLKQNHPVVFYLALIDTDARAHHGQYDNYLDAAQHADIILEDLWNFLQADPFYKGKTTLFITTDHGRGRDDEWTSHHNTFPNSDEIWFAVMGPDTPPLGEIRSPGQHHQNQFAKTMSALLGVEYDSGHPMGAAIPEVIKK